MLNCILSRSSPCLLQFTSVNFLFYNTIVFPCDILKWHAYLMTSPFKYSACLLVFILIGLWLWFNKLFQVWLSTLSVALSRVGGDKWGTSFLLHGAYMVVGTPKSKSPIHKVKGYGENRVCKSDHKTEAYYKSNNWTEKGLAQQSTWLS